jgi:hypothetical protein
MCAGVANVTKALSAKGNRSPWRRLSGTQLGWYAGPVAATLIGAIAACGGGTAGSTGDSTYCYSFRYLGDGPCCPVRWTKDVPAGATVILVPDHIGSCNLTVQTACVSGDCSAIRVRVAFSEIIVPSVVELHDVYGAGVTVLNTGSSAGQIEVAVSGYCTVCQLL